MGWKRRVHTALDRPGGRFALAIAGTAYATVRARRTCRVFQNGAWVHQYPDQEASVDAWTYQYNPIPRDIVVDVGAGTGWDTLLFSRQVGAGGRVISIEAHPRTFSCLEGMCRRNGLENVILLNCAVTASESQVLISDSVAYHSNTIIGNKSGVPIQGRTLDDIVTTLHLPRVDLLKMNIEGAERVAIYGFTDAVQKTRHVCISCHDFLADSRGGEDMRTKSTVITFLERNGFDVATRESETRSCIHDIVYGSNPALNGPHLSGREFRGHGARPIDVQHSSIF